MLRPTQLRLVVAVALGVLTAPAIVHAAGDVSVVLTARRVAVVDGKETLTPADQASPGDVIEYRAEYRNAGANAVKQLAATLPVPSGMEYLPQAGGVRAQLASLDGRTFEAIPLKRKVRLTNGREVVREVPLSEYRYLRWTLGTLASRQSRTVSARVRVTPLPMAAVTR